MESIIASTDTRAARPTQLIAEALLDRQNSTELISRAERLGFSDDMTEAVVTVCCRPRQGQKSADCQTMTAHS